MTRRLIIPESAHDIDALVSRYRGLPPERPLRMLLLVKKDPSLPLEDIATVLHCSSRTVRRWLSAYAERGLEGLLHHEPDDGHHLSVDQTLELRNALSSGNMSTIEEVREWIHARWGLEISPRGISGVLSRIGARRVWTVDAPAVTDDVATQLHENILRFTDEAGADPAPLAWSKRLTEIITPALHDVDDVSIAINMSAGLVAGSGNRSRSIISLYSSFPERSQRVALLHLNDVADPSQFLIREMRRRRYALNDYYAPILQDYYQRKSAYLATIVLWRARTGTPTSRQTAETLALTGNALTQAFTDYLTLRSRQVPTEHIFHAVLDRITDEGTLTAQEQQILTYRLFGRMYKEIAAELGITEDTVKKTLQKVYRKTGTRSNNELFAKYFVPRLG